MPESVAAIARLIDHSLLHPTITGDDVREGCDLAKRFGVASVCVKPCDVALATECLGGTQVAVGAVVGFPHGNSTIEIKIDEAERACEDGATELDMVVNIGKVLAEEWDYVEVEIVALKAVARKYDAILKVIFENDYLPGDAPKVKLCELCTTAEVDYVKTSTGYGYVKQADGSYNYAGATDHDLELMRRHCPESIGIKAAGKVRTLDDVLRVRALGVTRIGASATEAILTEAARRLRQVES